jgi:hypothetical protein
MTMTATDGTYLLDNLGVGAYTVTPSKPTQQCNVSNGIFSNDASLVSQFVVGIIQFTPDQLTAAKAGGTGTVSAFDAGVIARKVVGLCTHAAGQFRFMPANKGYASVVTNIGGEDYTAVMLGDVNGDWSPTGANRPAPLSTDTDAVRVSIPNAVAATGTALNVPIRIDQLRATGINSYQFDIVYDPAVIEPQDIAADLRGTLSDTLSVVTNVPTPGLLKAAVYGAYTVTGDGVYANLKFNVVGSSGTSTPITIRQFIYNDGSAGVMAVNGSVKITSREPLIRGRLLTAAGEPVINARVVLTSTTGASRTVNVNTSGYFEFSSLESGQTYIISVQSQTHVFAPQTISVVGSVTDVAMIAGQ